MLIGEVSDRSGVSPRMLRHYDALGLVSPTARTSGGYREYSAADLRRLFHVESLRTLGLSLEDVGRALDDPAFTPADLVGGLIRHTRQRIADEQELLARIERVDAAAPEQWEDVLTIVALLRGLESSSPDRRLQTALTDATPAALPVDALAAAYLAEDDQNVAGALQWALAREGARALAAVAVGLGSADPDVRLRAVAAIAAVESEDAAALLAGALDDADPDVRARATLALAAQGGAGAIPGLVEMIVVGDRDVEAAEALGRLAADSVAEAPAVETPAVETLAAQTPAAQAPVVKPLLDALHAGDVPVRLRITQALAEIPGPASAAALADLAEDADRTVAATAAAILATLPLS